ncbi:phage protein Gp13 family protein [Sulfuricurvum sp.]|uniref:phage protein Gp13 family protein n=1 Tax=Sulfuricurvum sp. TaxID=2025608 RepID=UPI003561D244
MEELDRVYDKDGIVVRRSVMEDVDYLKDRLRQSDVDEVWASGHHAPYEALRKSFDESIFSLTIVNGNPIGMFGVAPVAMIGARGSVWFLASDDLEKIGRRFVKNSRHFIDMMLMFRPYLYNFVDDRNAQSIKWLRICGAIIEDPQPYGKDGLLFRYFYFKRGA